MIRLYRYLSKIKITTAISSVKRIVKLKDCPIIIGGVGRSGTSLITAILDAHNEIKSFPIESNIFASKRKYKQPILNKYRNLF